MTDNTEPSPPQSSSPPASEPLSPMSSIRRLMAAARSDPPPQLAGTVRRYSEVDGNDDALDNDHRPDFQLDPDLFPPSAALVNPDHQAVLTCLRTLKTQRNLTGDALRDFEAFENGLSPAEQLGHVLVVALEVRDQLQLLALAQDYRLPETVKATAVDYAGVYILSPFIFQYKARNGPGDVLAAMRQLNVQNLPPASETSRCGTVLEVIKKAMTTVRHHIKEKIASSITHGPQDIATLTRACIGSYKAKPTGALFIRIALLRHIFVKLPKNTAAEKFWDKVDEYLTMYRQEYSQPGALHQMFTTVYNDDVNKYGSPDLVNHPQVAANNVEEWITKIAAVASRTA